MILENDSSSSQKTSFYSNDSSPLLALTAYLNLDAFKQAYRDCPYAMGCPGAELTSFIGSLKKPDELISRMPPSKIYIKPSPDDPKGSFEKFEKVDIGVGKSGTRYTDTMRAPYDTFTTTVFIPKNEKIFVLDFSTDCINVYQDAVCGVINAFLKRFQF